MKMQDRLIEYLEKNPTIHNKREIARQLKISYAYVILLFNQLRDLGKVEEIKTYKIKQN